MASFGTPSLGIRTAFRARFFQMEVCYVLDGALAKGQSYAQFLKLTPCTHRSKRMTGVE
ncbi:hypothetical protein [Helicobacter labacensis]|uniref:hypothetical protein n=1 Tax=Helicobacter labacensis TaxID=2316079 RepID=UPI0013CE0587|nr:hypothetical protein [Helicobacter labacensis]